MPDGVGIGPGEGVGVGVGVGAGAGAGEGAGDGTGLGGGGGGGAAACVTDNDCAETTIAPERTLSMAFGSTENETFASPWPVALLPR